MIIPIRGQPKRTTNTPPRKHELPFSLCFWKKNLKVLSNPITSANPAINNICKKKKWKLYYTVLLQLNITCTGTSMPKLTKSGQKGDCSNEKACYYTVITGLEITGHQTMSGLIRDLTCQASVLMVKLTGHIYSYQNQLKFLRCCSTSMPTQLDQQPCSHYFKF